MKLFVYCKRQLQMYMTHTWSQITITFCLFQKWVFCVLHACYTLFSDIANLQIHQLWSILKQFLKEFKNNTELLHNYCFVFRLCIILETLVYRRILTMCHQNCIPYGVGIFSFLLQSISPTCFGYLSFLTIPKW